MKTPYKENLFRLPRQEDVSEIELGIGTVTVVRLTDENRSEMANAALSMYLGESCVYCGRVYNSLESLKGTIWAGDGIACGECWRDSN